MPESDPIILDASLIFPPCAGCMIALDAETLTVMEAPDVLRFTMQGTLVPPDPE